MRRRNGIAPQRAASAVRWLEALGALLFALIRVTANDLPNPTQLASRNLISMKRAQ